MKNLHGTVHCLRIVSKKFLDKWDNDRDGLKSYAPEVRCDILENMVVQCLLEIQLLQKEVKQLKESRKELVAGITGLWREESDD